MNETGAEQGKKIYPPVYFLGAILLMVTLHYTLPLRTWNIRPWNLAGILLIFLGVSSAIVANIQFRRQDTTVKPFQLSSTVVTAGAFGYSRNPMYLGMVLVLAGIAVIQGSLSPIAVIPLFAWQITARFIREEERSMEEQFGEKYLNYKKSVRRWL